MRPLTLARRRQDALQQIYATQAFKMGLPSSGNLSSSSRNSIYKLMLAIHGSRGEESDRRVLCPSLESWGIQLPSAFFYSVRSAAKAAPDLAPCATSAARPLPNSIITSALLMVTSLVVLGLLF